MDVAFLCICYTQDSELSFLKVPFLKLVIAFEGLRVALSFIGLNVLFFCHYFKESEQLALYLMPV